MYTILTNTRVHPEQTAPAHALVEVLGIGALAGAGGAQHGAQYANHCGAAPTGPAGALLGHAVHCTGLLVVLQLESVAIKKRSHYVNTCSLSLSPHRAAWLRLSAWWQLSSLLWRLSPCQSAPLLGCL